MERRSVLATFENFTLDRKRRELRRDGEPVAVEPQVFDLLVCLVAHRDRVVDRDMMLAEVWDGRIVSELTLTTCINAARRALGDSGREQPPWPPGATVSSPPRRPPRPRFPRSIRKPRARPSTSAPSRTIRASCRPPGGHAAKANHVPLAIAAKATRLPEPSLSEPTPRPRRGGRGVAQSG